MTYPDSMGSFSATTRSCRPLTKHYRTLWVSLLVLRHRRKSRSPVVVLIALLFLFLFLFLVGFHRLATPFIVVGCRTDLPQQVSPEVVADDCSHYEAGLVLTTTTTEDGAKKMQGAFSWIVKAVLRRREGSKE